MSTGQFVSRCTADAITSAASSIKAGNLVAFPTETVYGLGADASSADAVAKIYVAKGRPADHPLIVHISSMDGIGYWADEISEYAIALARTFWPGRPRVCSAFAKPRPWNRPKPKTIMLVLLAPRTCCWAS